MGEPIYKRVQESNLKIRSILSCAENALAGRQDITAENIREMSQTLAEMGTIIAEAGELRAMDTRLDAGLKEYAGNLLDLQTALDQVRFMLLARQTKLEASRHHLESVNLWATAFQQTR
jgi:hypothetical protein